MNYHALKLYSTDKRIGKLYASFFTFGLVNGLGLCLLSLLIFRAAYLTIAPVILSLAAIVTERMMLSCRA